jgi:hypothetical protein
MMLMPKQHKWHKEIKAWADGAEIEFNNFHNKDLWMLDTNPDWYATHGEFRIKPQPKEPQYLYVYKINKEIKFCEPHGIIEVPSGKQNIIKLGKIELEDL